MLPAVPRPDGSPIFAALAEMPQCTLLHHDVNRGKGRGLKTGFAYILAHMPECSGVVTTDDDGVIHAKSLKL